METVSNSDTGAGTASASRGVPDIPTQDVGGITATQENHEPDSQCLQPSTSQSTEEVDYSWAAKLVERPIDADRRVRVVCIGAGYSGIGSAIHAREHLRNVDFQIYDMSDDFGGVWHHNRYAGVACDVPSHSYQFSFCENTQWSGFYAPGPEIHDYLKKVVQYYNLRPLMKLRHKVIGATWSGRRGKWVISVNNLDSGVTFEDEADFVLYATGLLSKPKWPSIPGREIYRGTIHHTGSWDLSREEAQPGFSWDHQKVAVIGVGSSAIQVLPVMAKKASHVTNFARSRTWLSSSFASGILDGLEPGGGTGNHTFTNEEKAKFRDPVHYREFRRMIELDLNSSHKMTEQGQPLQRQMRETLDKMMREKLCSKPDIAKQIIPDFPVACKRLTPGPGYLEALCSENVHFDTSEIISFTQNGLMTADGRELEFDTIICATGFDTTVVPGFPIIGEGGVNLQDLWAEEAKQYLAVSVPHMPNFFAVLTAASGVGSGSLLVLMEQQIAYITKCLQKCIREGYKSIVVKDSAVESWLKYTDDYFDRTVYMGNCKSWYKNGAYGKARIRTLWPGSCLHGFTALKHPRWEDYEYERLEEYFHPMAWLGNGDIRSDLDKAFYTDELRGMKKDHPFFT